MNPLYNEFKGDIEHLRKLIALSDNVKLFTSSNVASTQPRELQDNFVEKGIELQKLGREAKIGITFVPGTLILYLAGRFEFFIRVLFEELAAGVANKCLKFDNLPKDFKENLFVYTAEVMKTPRKYGHAENGRNAFVNNLSDNIKGLDLNSINVKCISITTDNMRPNILSDLFGRIGAKEIWTKVGQHPKMQVFFESHNPTDVTRDAKKKLEEFMDLRNTVAHPSDSFNWPDSSTVLNFIDYIESLSFVLDDISNVYLISLPPKKDNVAILDTDITI